MRGFALTAQCPRCGTEKPTGGDVAPLVSCGTCGLSFDPRPREVRPRKPTERTEPVVETPLVDEEFDERHALLTIKESRFEGWTLTGLAGAAAWGIAIASSFVYLPVALIGAYVGLTKLVSQTHVLVTVDAIEVIQQPIARLWRRRFPDAATASRAIAGFDTKLGNEIEEAIERHRARLLALLAQA